MEIEKIYGWGSSIAARQVAEELISSLSPAEKLAVMKAERKIPYCYLRPLVSYAQVIWGIEDENEIIKKIDPFMDRIYVAKKLKEEIKCL